MEVHYCDVCGRRVILFSKSDTPRSELHGTGSCRGAVRPEEWPPEARKTPPTVLAPNVLSPRGRGAEPRVTQPGIVSLE